MQKLLVFILLFSSLAQAETKQSLSIFAGSGLTHTSLTGGATYTVYHFENPGFVMGFEYAHNFMVSPYDPIPLFINGTFVTNSTALIGLGVDLSVLRITAKIGYGLVNSEPNTLDSNLTASANYGLVGGAGAEFRFSEQFGICVNYISNKTYLGGISVHW